VSQTALFMEKKNLCNIKGGELVFALKAWM